MGKAPHGRGRVHGAWGRRRVLWSQGWVRTAGHAGQVDQYRQWVAEQFFSSWGELGPVAGHFSQQPEREGGNGEFYSYVQRVRIKHGLEPQDRGKGG